MKKLTKDGIIDVKNKEAQFISDSICSQKHSKDVHYLAFDRQLTGFSPLGCFLSENKISREKENDIIGDLLKMKEVCSLLPCGELVTLYPIEKVEDGNFYNLLLENIDKHFKDILEINDKVYKTKYMFVDFGHGANNMQDENNYNLVLSYLRKLKDESKVLKEIYFY